jgi:hypothetical protein
LPRRRHRIPCHWRKGLPSCSPGRWRDPCSSSSHAGRACPTHECVRRKRKRLLTLSFQLKA